MLFCLASSSFIAKSQSDVSNSLILFTTIASSSLYSGVISLETALEEYLDVFRLGVSFSESEAFPSGDFPLLTDCRALEDLEEAKKSSSSMEDTVVAAVELER